MTQQGVALSVVSERRGPGYRCVLYLGEEVLRVFDRDSAAAYCAEWSWAIGCAEHDAAVLAQLTKMEIPTRYLKAAIRHLRADRRPILESALAGISVSPIVSNSTREGMLDGTVRGVRFQWDLTTARTHVMYVMEVSAGVDLDDAYAAHLRGVVGLDEAEADRYVSSLRNFMPSSTHDHPDPPPTPG